MLEILTLALSYQLSLYYLTKILIGPTILEIGLEIDPRKFHSIIKRLLE